MNVPLLKAGVASLDEAKSRLWLIALAWSFLLLLWAAGVHPASAQGARFFRIAGLAATGTTGFRPDGMLDWTNAESGTDYVQLPVTSSVNPNLIFSFNPPAGMVHMPEGGFTMGNSASDADRAPMVRQGTVAL